MGIKTTDQTTGTPLPALAAHRFNGTGSAEVALDIPSLESRQLSPEEPFARYILHTGTKALALATAAHGILERFERGDRNLSPVVERFGLTTDPLRLSLRGLPETGIPVVPSALTVTSTFWPDTPAGGSQFQIGHPDFINPIAAANGNKLPGNAPAEFFKLVWLQDDLLNLPKMAALLLFATELWRAALIHWRTHTDPESPSADQRRALVTTYDRIIESYAAGDGRLESLTLGRAFMDELAKAPTIRALHAFNRARKALDNVTEPKPKTRIKVTAPTVAPTIDSPAPPPPAVTSPPAASPAPLPDPQPLEASNSNDEATRDVPIAPAAALSPRPPVSPALPPTKPPAPARKDTHEASLHHAQQLNRDLFSPNLNTRREAAQTLQAWDKEASQEVLETVRLGLITADRVSRAEADLTLARKLLDKGDLAECIAVLKKDILVSPLRFVREEGHRLAKHLESSTGELPSNSPPDITWSASEDITTLRGHLMALRFEQIAYITTTDGLRIWGQIAFFSPDARSFRLINLEKQFATTLRLDQVNQLRGYFFREHPHAVDEIEVESD